MRGESKVVELIDGAEWIGIPSIALGELHSGFLAGRHTARNEEELDRHGDVFRILEDVGHDDAKQLVQSAMEELRAGS